jgi:hypothetical protein
LFTRSFRHRWLVLLSTVHSGRKGNLERMQHRLDRACQPI